MSLTAVTLGNFYTTASGKNVLGGAGGSGLDEQALITSLTNASEAQSTQDQTQITANNAKSSAFTQLQSLLTTYQSAAAAISNSPGNTSSNVFADTVASVGNGGNNYVNVTTAPGAATGTYDISNITSLASAASQYSSVFDVASADADATTGIGAVFTPGTITFAGSGATVTVNSGDSLNTIAGNFNAVSAQTGIGATVIQVGSGEFVLSFTATNTGTDGNFDLTNSSTVASGESVLTGITLQPAASGSTANFQINGVPIASQTNNVSNAISGVTFNILQTTPANEDPENPTEYPVTIGPNTSSVGSAVTAFVNAYNQIQAFGATQTALNSSGTFVSSAVLASDPTFTSIMNSVDEEVEGQAANLSQIGITFTNLAATSTAPAASNLLQLDSTTLNSALTSDFTGVQSTFGLNTTSSNANFALYSHTQPIGVTNFTVNIDPGSNSFTATYTQNGQTVTSNLTATPTAGFSTGYTLTGAAGSALAGTTFLYVSTAAATINMTVSQGLADQANLFSTAALTPSTGPLAVALTGLQASDTQLNTDITNVKNQANVYQQQLIAEFSALEQAISNSNTLLQSLNADSNAALESANA